MPRRYFHRSDDNQAEMVKVLRALGLKVHCWDDEADLVVQHAGLTVLCEVRREGQPRKPRKGRQEKFQREFCVKWIQTQEDCIELAKTLRKWQQTLMTAGVG